MSFLLKKYFYQFIINLKRSKPKIRHRVGTKKINKMENLEHLGTQFNLDELANQLQTVIDTKDPFGYMQSNINWEIDNNTETNPLIKSSAFEGNAKAITFGFVNWNPFSRFMNWLKRNRVANSVKKVLCNITAKIKELIDEEAELKTILGVALAAIVTALGIGAINPLLLTVLVGFLATMILNGVDNFCAI